MGRLTELLRAIYLGDEKTLKGLGAVKAAMAEGSGITGGYTVGEDFAAKLMSVANEMAIVRPRASYYRMERDTLNVPGLRQDLARSANTAPYFGGMQFAFAGEASLDESEPDFARVTLRANKLNGYGIISNELLDDADDDVWYEFLGTAIAWYEDWHFLRGTGVGSPLGVINAGCAKTVTRQTASQVQTDDLRGMFKALLPASYPNAVWVVGFDVVPEILPAMEGSPFALHAAMRSWIHASYSWPPALRRDYERYSLPFTHAVLPGSIMGLPVLVTDKLPALGSRGDVILADFTAYAVGDRGGTDIQISRYAPTQYAKDQSVIRVKRRIDGQPKIGQAITLADGSSTASPFVVLV